MESPDIEVKIRSITGAHATFDAPLDTSLMGLLMAGGEQIDEDLIELIQSKKYCLSLVLPNLDDHLSSIAAHPGMELQISLINKVPEKKRLKVKDVYKVPKDTAKG